MEKLAVEILDIIVETLPQADLLSLLCVNRLCSRVAISQLYSDIELSLFFTNHTSRAYQCIRTLDNSDAAAKSLRHLKISGLVTSDDTIQCLLFSVLTKASGLLSMDIDFQRLPATHIFRQSIWMSSEFLPRLSALKTDSAEVACLLVPSRPVRSIFVCATGNPTKLIKHLSRSASPVKQLQLQIEADSIDAAVTMLQFTVQTFSALVDFGIEFRLPSPAEATWPCYTNAIERMLPSISSLRSLRTLSIVVSPDAVLPNADYEAKTLEVAQRIANLWGPNLQRIETRWHGWIIHASGWKSVARQDLLRMSWLYKSSIYSTRTLRS